MLHIVDFDDTLQSIASRYNSKVEDIIEANRLTNPASIFYGQVLLIPNADFSPNGFTYTVQPGETLHSLSEKFNLPIEPIIEANHSLPPYKIHPGQQLYMSGIEEAAPPKHSILYIIEPGDTIASIAAKFNTSIQSVIEINRLLRPDLIYPGQRIFIPSVDR